MKISSLHKKIKSIYKNQLENHSKNTINSHLKYKEEMFLKNLTKLVGDYGLTDLEAKRAPELNSLINKASAFVSELTKESESKPSIDTLSGVDYQKETKNSVQNYQEAVSSYSNNGGKGFYDVGINAIFQIEQYKDQFMQGIKQATEKGIDIQILEETAKTFENSRPFGSEYRGTVLLTMPSSKLSEFHDILREIEPELVDINSNRYAPTYNSYFITPYFRAHKQVSVEKAKEYLSGTEETASHRTSNALTILGISRSEIMTSGFPGSESGLEHTSYAMNRSFHHADLYSQPHSKKGGRHEHVNGLMPNLFVYSDDELEKLGVEESMILNISIPREIELHDLELNQTLDMTR